MSVERRETKQGVRYDVRLRDPDGKAYMRTFRTRRQAETFEARERADRSRGGWIDPRRGEKTFTEVAANWLASNPSKRQSAYARDEGIIRRHLDPLLGARPIAAITPRDVQELVSSWAKELAPRTVRRQYGVVKAVFFYAIDLDLIVRSPCRGIKVPAAPHEDRHIVNGDELGTLSDALGTRCGPVVYLAAVLGLRLGECAGLRVGRIDFLRNTITVAEQRTRGLLGSMVAGPPKSDAGRRTITAPKALMDILSAHLQRRGLTGADESAHVFTGPEGQPLEYANFRRRSWMPAVKAAGLVGLTFHDLRRANATGLVAEGVDVKTAQTRLGHADPRTTLAIYAQATKEGDRVAADRLGERFMPAPAKRARDERAMELFPENLLGANQAPRKGA